MFKDTKAYSGFAVDDPDAAKQFYGETLGIDVKVEDPEYGLLTLNIELEWNVVGYLARVTEILAAAGISCGASGGLPRVTV